MSVRVSNAGLPPTRIISFQQVVLDADPEWYLRFQRPWIYQWSNGRRFYQQVPYPNTIVNNGLIDNGGFICLSPSNPSYWPTSATGLPQGAAWNNGGFVSVAGWPFTLSEPNEFTPQWFGLDAATLLFEGLSNVPTVSTFGGLFINNGFLCLSQTPSNPGLQSDNGVVMLVDPSADWPTQVASGFYNNGGVVSIAGGSFGHQAVSWYGITDTILLETVNPANLPNYDPNVQGRLWNNGGVLSISQWGNL